MFGEHCLPVSSVVPAPESMKILFFSRVMSLMASATDAADVPAYRRLEDAGVTLILTMPWAFYAGLTDDLVTFFAQHLGQVHPDESLVLGDKHSVRLDGWDR